MAETAIDVAAINTSIDLGPDGVTDHAPDKSKFVRVKTTLPKRPFPPNSARKAVYTERLIIRPLSKNDLAALHELRTQPEVMVWTYLGVVDKDVGETWRKLEQFVEGNEGENYNCAICERETGEMVGIGGFHNSMWSFGWPEIGYMFRRECWGRGYAKEFMRGWNEIWGGLEREGVEVEVDGRTVVRVEDGDGDGDDGGVVRVKEVVIAVTVEENKASQRVLERSGFERFLTWKEEDGGGRGMVKLPTYRYLVGGRKVGTAGEAGCSE
ncbi:GNAT domain-containing protein [Triangularia verruculosa]|uniref:GNAT domain-containing protein n=1 Tax=Triangularia verruculosa TaxID=2587418 RepID=A0AAN6X689_9PEZI|nr:GNAT domain-containing protein [Triangularia verruculosa]